MERVFHEQMAILLKSATTILEVDAAEKEIIFSLPDVANSASQKEP
jgi:hypothetical protein